MKERLILNPQYVLKGWKKLPYAIYDTKGHRASFLNKAQFDLVLQCSGKQEIDAESLPAPLRSFLDEMKKAQIVHAAEEGETRDLYYKFYDNIYKRNVHWSITGRCNYHCIHCFQSAPCGELMQPTLEQCRDIIHQFAECGIGSVGITGGEPLVHPDFMAIVDELIANNIAISVIYSNGKLVTQELLDQFHERGLYPSFQISFDGVGYHDWMRGVPGAEKIALDAIRLLRKNGHGVSSAMCLCKENIGSLRETIKVLAEAGCGGLKTQCVSPQGLWATQKEHFLTYDQVLQAYVDYIPQYAEDNMPLSLQMEGFFSYDKATNEYCLVADKSVPENFALSKIPVCGVIHSSFYLGPSGNVVPCMSLDYIEMTDGFPNIYDMPLKQILSDSSFTEAMTKRVSHVLDHSPECAECEYRSKCCGGCRAFAAVNNPADYLAADKVTCKIFKEHWDEKLYTVADQYFTRKTHKAAEGEDQPAGC